MKNRYGFYFSVIIIPLTLPRKVQQIGNVSNVFDIQVKLVKVKAIFIGNQGNFRKTLHTTKLNNLADDRSAPAWRIGY